jgi:peptidoglycan/LPS O-acetylase OafA/YrhL
MTILTYSAQGRNARFPRYRPASVRGREGAKHASPTVAASMQHAIPNRFAGAGRASRASPVARARADSRVQAAVATTAHRADIQGLRAVAVLLVVLAHAGVRFVSAGYVGVDVFFVLSGFLITGLLLAEARKSGSVSLRNFYLRRARRILPAAALTLLVTNIAAFYLLNFVRARDAVYDGLHAAGFAANFHFAASGVDYFARGEPPSPLLHYWSLSVEEQFYLVWPLLLSIALFGVAAWRHRGAAAGHERRLLVGVVALAAASLGWSVHLTSAAPTAAYFSPFTRGWELGLGAAVAVGAATLARLPSLVKLAMGWSGVAAIAAAAGVFSDQTPFPGSAALLPTMGTALAIVAGMGGAGSRFSVGRLLALRPMFAVGDRSYAFYLWHWPVLILAEGYAGHALSVSTKLALVAAAFVLSCISYALVENPIRRRVRRPRTTLVLVAASTAAILGTATASLAGIDRAQQRFEGTSAGVTSSAPLDVESALPANGALPSVIAAVAAAREGAPIPSGLKPPLDRLKGLPPQYAPANECIGHDVGRVIATKICRLGDVSSRTLIVLMGDSHAYMWLPAAIKMARYDHVALVPILRLGCTPGEWQKASGSGHCAEWFRWAAREIARLKPSVTLLGGSVDQRPTPATRAAVEGVVAGARDLERLGRAVVVIGDPESLDRNPVDCVLSRRASMASCTTHWPPESLAAYDEIARRVTSLGSGFVRTRGLVCYRGSCPAVIGHTLAWADDNHLSAAYSAEVAGSFRAEFRAALAQAAH